MPVSQKLQDFAGTPTRVVIFLFVALVLIALMGIAITQRDSKTTPTKNNTDAVKKEIVTLSPHTLIYGSWTSNRSIITAYDLSTGREGIIAVLPVNIKKVTVTSPNTLLFISGVANAQDHGREIVEYNLLSQTQKTVYKASEGFGIDDYVISPDFHTIAVWEAQLDKEVGTLLNGQSRVYTTKLGEETKYLIYDDESVSETNPAHYPLAVTNNGTVFTDRFLPNSSAGWAYGMSVSNFNGSEKKDLDTMQNGTYSTQPILSPDGKYLAFAGYDGSKGSGVSDVEGFRRALVIPNTVELLDTSTYERIKQTNLPNTNLYPVVEWNNNTNLFVVSQGTTEQNTGSFNYNIDTQTFSQSKTPETDDEQYLVKELSDSAWLIGHQDSAPSLIGNLGKTYEAPYTVFSIYNPQTKKVTKLQTATGLKQLITIIPATSFGSFTTIIETRQPNEDNLQLKTFSIKSDLAPTREEQQSIPRCRDLASTMCKNNGQQSCSLTVTEAKREGRCYDSPLYLYGNTGQKVKVSILTPVSNTNPLQNGTFTATLKSNGNMEVDGNEYDSIDFDYISALRRFTPPSYGSIIQKSQLTKTVKEYANKLGLNEKETDDLISYAGSVAKGKYIFVSFFDHETSAAMLPITFDPKPDVYRNIVFYFKNLDQKPNFSVQPPTFDPIVRHGFTAIEISGIAE